jgi:hypothetical protein
MRVAAKDWPVRDAVILAGSLALLSVVSVFLLLEGPEPSGASATVAFATVAERSGSVRHRPAASLVWDDARRGERLGDGASLFVGPGGSAAVVLDGGGRLDVEENSLVVLEPVRAEGDAATVTLRRGGVSATAASPVRIRSAAGEATLRPGAQARVTGGAEGARLEVALLDGDASVSGAEAVLARFPVRLEAPAPSRRVYVSAAAPAVELRWDGAAASDGTVEVARDEGFGAPVAAFPGGRGAAAFTPPSPGTYYWRAVDARRAPRSETRAVAVVQDEPPLPYAPADGDVVLALPGRSVPFWWTEVDGASAYVVEIAASPSFDDLALSVPTDRPGAWIEPKLPEGTYHWRVRAADPARGLSPFSRRSSFRLVHAAVPEAPELLDATLQVDHAGG